MLKHTYQHLVNLLPKKYEIFVRHLRAHGRIPRTNSPTRFSDFQYALKSMESEPLMVLCADKIRAKDWVAAKADPAIVNPTLWSGKILPDQEMLESFVPFVLKSNHASQTIEIVTDPDFSRHPSPDIPPFLTSGSTRFILAA